jgi:hypothetical protein
MNYSKLTPEVLDKYLEKLAETNNFTLAAASIAYSSMRMYQLRKSDPEFEAKCEAAQACFCEKLVAEVVRRAYHGVKKPIFYNGWQTGYIVEYSDTLLMFVTKRYDPAFRDNYKVELTGKDGGAIETKGTVLNVDYDPTDAESVARAHEQIFGAPQALTLIKGGKGA